MLNKPKFMKPSTNKEECTIDIEADKIPFSCIVDGNEAVTAWEIIIYNIDNNNPVFDTGEKTLDTPFYPVDEKNRNVLFEVDLNKYTNILDDKSKFINRSEAYYWTITLWGDSNNSVTSCQEVFYANKTLKPRFKYKIDKEYQDLSNGAILTSRTCTFKAEVEKDAQNQLKRYGWRITDTDSKQVLIDTISNNQIYGSVDNIVCSYDGFLNDSNYSVELFIETQNNAKIYTTPITFSVSYESTFLSNDFKVEVLQTEPAVVLDWSDSVVVGGVLKDKEGNVIDVDDTVFRSNYPVENQCSIEIPDGFKVVYDYDSNSNLDIDENSYIVYSAQLLSDKETTLFLAEGSDDKGNVLGRELTYKEGCFYYEFYNYDGDTTSGSFERAIVKNRPSPYVWYIFFMPPLTATDNFKVIESYVKNCIYPSEELYPNTDLYPIFGTWDKLKSTNKEEGVDGI